MPVDRLDHDEFRRVISSREVMPHSPVERPKVVLSSCIQKRFRVSDSCFSGFYIANYNSCCYFFLRFPAIVVAKSKNAVTQSMSPTTN